MFTAGGLRARDSELLLGLVHYRRLGHTLDSWTDGRMHVRTTSRHFLDLELNLSAKHGVD